MRGGGCVEHESAGTNGRLGAPSALLQSASKKDGVLS